MVGRWLSGKAPVLKTEVLVSVEGSIPFLPAVLGHSQVVRHWILAPTSEGSKPSVPKDFKSYGFWPGL